MLTDADRRVLLAADPRNSRVFRSGRPEGRQVAVVEIPLAVDVEALQARKARVVDEVKPR